MDEQMHEDIFRALGIIVALFMVLIGLATKSESMAWSGMCAIIVIAFNKRWSKKKLKWR